MWELGRIRTRNTRLVHIIGTYLIYLDDKYIFGGFAVKLRAHTHYLFFSGGRAGIRTLKSVDARVAVVVFTS